MQHCIQNYKDLNILFLARSTGISFLIQSTAECENRRKKNLSQKNVDQNFEMFAARAKCSQYDWRRQPVPQGSKY